MHVIKITHDQIHPNEEVDIISSLENSVSFFLAIIDANSNKIEEYKKKFINILDSINIGIVEVDSDTLEIINANIYACKLLGITKDSIIGRKCYETICIHGKERECRLKKKPVNSEINGIECFITSKTGEKIPVIKSAIKILGEDSRFHIIESFVDIRKQKIKEQELIDAKIESENSVRARNIFVSKVSHELRTPLTLIIGHAGLMLEDPEKLSYDVRTALTDIYMNGNFLLRLINDILDVTKIESGEIVFQKSEFSLQELIENVYTTMQNTAANKDIEFSIEFNADKFDHYVIGDQDRLKQVLLNLVGNSIKFTNYGYVKIIIKVLEETDLKYKVEFLVEDTGIGINKKQQLEIFTPFKQTDESISRKYGGTGLGLAICKKIINMLDSDILVSSSPGNGSIFSFSLYLVKGAKIDNLSYMKDDNPDHSPTWDGKGLKILVVEDNHNTRRMITKFLEKYEHIPIMAENGTTAIAKIRLDIYDVILMDVQMPGMDGLECTTILRKEGYKTPIIAFTANAFSDDIKKCLDSGMNDFISKPIKNSKILQNKIGEVYTKNKIKKYDKKECLDYHDGDKSFVEDELSKFKESFQSCIDTLKIAYDSKDFNEIRRLSHSYKTDCKTLGFERLRVLLYNIEKLSMSNIQTGIGLLLLRLNEEFQELKDEI